MPSHRRTGTAAGPWLVLAALTFLGADLCAQRPPRPVTEEQIRPVFLYQVAQYLTWPEDKTGAALRFCVLGDDELAAALETALRGKTIQGRPLTAGKVSGPEEMAACQVAFIGFTQRKQLQDLFARWTYPPVLLVGQAEGFAELGGMVNLKIADRRVVIEINLDTARRAGLSLRSQLLQVAHIVSGTGARQ